MYYDVYIDIVFLTNLLMDYVLLRIVGKLFLRKRNRGRILLAAAVGALFSCLILYVLPDMIFLQRYCSMEDVPGACWFLDWILRKTDFW